MKKKWYKGKVFVITGATGDIGSAVCRKFAPLGLRMYLTDIDNPKLEKLVDEVTELGAEYAEGIEMDVTNKEQVNSAIKSMGEKEKYIDILYNNAGFGKTISVTNEGPFEEYRKIMSVNIDGMWLVTQAALPYIGRPAPTKKNPDRREGQLIFMSSSAGKVGVPNMAAYSMSKHAVVALADCTRSEFKIMGHKIHVITICPAPAKTKFWDSTEEYKEWLKKYESKGILYKLVTAEQVANMVFKASRKNLKEAFVPRWWWLLSFANVISRGLISNLMIKIEKGKEDAPNGK